MIDHYATQQQGLHEKGVKFQNRVIPDFSTSRLHRKGRGPPPGGAEGHRLSKYI